MTEKSGWYAGVRSLTRREKAKNGDPESRVNYITAGSKRSVTLGSLKLEKASKILQH